MIFEDEKMSFKLYLFFFILVAQIVFSTKAAYAYKVLITDKQAKVLQSLNTDSKSQTTKSLRVKITKLKDNHGQAYLGARVSRAELSPYLTQLQELLGKDFNHYRALQAARDHQLFYLIILSPKEYQFADKALIDKLLTPDVNHAFSSQLKFTLFGLGKVAQNNKESFFVVANSADAQLIRQRFILPAKDFHITLGFNPSDIYGVKKDRSTLINQ